MSFKLIITCRQTSSEQIQCQSLSRNYMTMDGFWCQGQGKFYYINTWVRVCSNLTLFGFGSSLVLLVVYMMIEDQMTFIWTCPQISSCQHKRNLRKSMKNMMWTVNCMRWQLGTWNKTWLWYIFLFCDNQTFLHVILP